MVLLNLLSEAHVAELSERCRKRRLRDRQRACRAANPEHALSTRRAWATSTKGSASRRAARVCHSTGLIRGMLCTRCNTGLGMLRDSVINLRAAVAYLKEPPASRIVYAREHAPLSRRELAQLTGRRHKGMVDAYRMPELVAFQAYRCAICETNEPGKKGWSADHDHRTGLLRGALCTICNAGIGRFADSILLLGSAISYLECPPAAEVRRVSQ